MYPLRFTPVFKDYIWGGTRLSSILGKNTGPGVWAESWEVVDHLNGQSVVNSGPWKGQSLSELLAQHGSEIVGQSTFEQITASGVPDGLRGRFPLLLKFLDASRVLSVQVHPDDRMGSTLTPPDLGKTEAWYILDAQPDSKIYAGLKQGVSRADLESAIADGKTESVLHSFTPQPGDCVFIEAGTVHAIGAGLLVCEIQQASDTTFRLFDWNRVGNDGNPRPLHVQQGLDAINFQLGPVNPVAPTRNKQAENLVTCDKFILNRIELERSMTIGGEDKFHILAVVKGEISIKGDPCSSAMKTGSSALLPANCPPVEITAHHNSATILEIRLP